MKTPRPSASSRSSVAQTRRDSDLESFRDIADDVIESDFVPYACLFDPHTIATKNGELVQIIKITGLGYDVRRASDLRGAIRQAIRQCIPDANYAIWLHTLRRRQQLIAQRHFPDAFSGQVDRAWSETHPASASFVNELYITIVKASGRNQPVQAQWLRTLSLGRFRQERTAEMEAAGRTLSTTAKAFVAALGHYGARRLSVVERDGVAHAEQLEFLEKLINLEARAMPVPMRDLSQLLTSGDITFGHNSMEVRTAEGKRRFACILTLKEYKESTLRGIDQFLSIPCEFIISQCFDFIGAGRAQEAYETQARYLSISNDTELAQWMEIDRLTTRGGTGRDFGEQQTTLFLIAPGVKQLEANVKLTQKALSRLGIVAIREDLRLEECYWAQLPGNFTFISRKQSVDTQHVAGFATLQTEPMGNASGSPWGPPASLFTTIQDAPYFFNFQRDASAHTILLGKPRSGRNGIAHFLLSQTRHLPLKLWYLDAHHRAAPFMRAMGGDVQVAGSTLALNPFAMADSPTNREFLAIWLTTLLDPEGKQLSRSIVDFFQQLVGMVMALPPAQRRLSSLLPFVREADAMLASQLQRWCAGGEFGQWFDHPVDALPLTDLLVIDIGAAIDNPSLRVPLAGYLLHRFTTALDGTPTLLVLDEGLSLLDNPLFGGRAAAWLDYLSQRQAGAFFLSSDIVRDSALAFTPAVAGRAASIFAMPDEQAGAEYALGFGLSEGDIATLHYMQRGAHHVLLKRGDEATLLKIDLSNLGVHYDTLSGRTPVIAPQKSPADLLSELMGFGAPL